MAFFKPPLRFSLFPFFLVYLSIRSTFVLVLRWLTDPLRLFYPRPGRENSTGSRDLGYFVIDVLEPLPHIYMHVFACLLTMI